MKSLLRHIGDTGQHVSKQGARIDAVQLCSLDQAVMAAARSPPWSEPANWTCPGFVPLL
jgi:hypothetical protein